MSSRKELIQSLFVFKPCFCAASFSLMQVLCAVGLCGGHNLRDQDRQEEGESLDVYFNITVTIEVGKRD